MQIHKDESKKNWGGEELRKSIGGSSMLDLHHLASGIFPHFLSHTKEPFGRGV